MLFERFDLHLSGAMSILIDESMELCDMILLQFFKGMFEFFTFFFCCNECINDIGGFSKDTVAEKLGNF